MPASYRDQMLELQLKSLKLQAINLEEVEEVAKLKYKDVTEEIYYILIIRESFLKYLKENHFYSKGAYGKNKPFDRILLNQGKGGTFYASKLFDSSHVKKYLFNVSNFIGVDMYLEARFYKKQWMIIKC